MHLRGHFLLLCGFLLSVAFSRGSFFKERAYRANSNGRDSSDETFAVYGKVGGSVVLSCDLYPMGNSEFEGFENTVYIWSNDKGLKKASSRKELLLEDLDVDDNGLYYCQEKSEIREVDAKLRCTVKLVVYEIPFFRLETSFTVEKEGTCDDDSTKKMKKLVVKSFCPSGKFLKCPFTFSISCTSHERENKKPSVSLFNVTMKQYLDVEFKLPSCDPNCIYYSIMQRLSTVYENGRELLNQEFAVGPVTAPPNLPIFSKLFYLVGMSKIPSIIWGSPPIANTENMVVECKGGFSAPGTIRVCLPCSPGYYSTDGLTCEPCPFGTYQESYGMDICYTCPAVYSEKDKEKVPVSCLTKAIYRRRPRDLFEKSREYNSATPGDGTSMRASVSPALLTEVPYKIDDASRSDVRVTVTAAPVTTMPLNKTTIIWMSCVSCLLVLFLTGLVVIIRKRFSPEPVVTNIANEHCGVGQAEEANVNRSNDNGCKPDLLYLAGETPRDVGQGNARSFPLLNNVNNGDSVEAESSLEFSPMVGQAFESFSPQMLTSFQAPTYSSTPNCRKQIKARLSFNETPEFTTLIEMDEQARKDN